MLELSVWFGPQAMNTPIAGSPRNWFERWKDTITPVASIISMAAFLFAAFQFYLARQILEAEATARALQNGRAIIAQIEAAPNTAAEIYGVSNDDLRKNLFVQEVISLYSEQFVLSKAHILSTEHWNIFKKELCDFYHLKTVEPRVTDLLKRGSYPTEFSDVLRSCK